jgi:cysteine desulfurase/selenocysteine lyase
MATLDELVGDEAVRRREFPICGSKIYLAHAGIAPLPARVAAAICEQTQRTSEQPQDFPRVLEQIAAVRASAARLIDASPDEIALLGPTSLGLSLVANGLDWRAGDEVVCYADDYPANVYPWLELRRRGVEIVYLKADSLGAITSDAVATALTKRTRLVALASAHFVSGYRPNLKAIGELLRGRNILLSVDGIQTLGAFPLSAKDMDFMSADSHKWLLGPETAGIVYVKKSRFEELRPTLLGGWNVHAPNFIAQREVSFASTAKRYEPGSLNMAGLLGMKAAIDLVLEIGRDVVAQRILDLKSELVRGLEEIGFEVIGPISGERASGITSCLHPKAESARLFAALARNEIVASLRQDRGGKAYLRFSPHFYNTAEEIAKVTETLRRELGA